MTNPTVRLGHAGIICGDIDRSLAFYDEHFGLRTLTVTTPPAGPFARMAALAAGNQAAILLFEMPDSVGEPAGDLGARGHLDHFSFLVDDVEELEAVAARLHAAGVSDGVVTELGPVFSVVFVDPDGFEQSVQASNPAWVADPFTQVVDEELLGAVLGRVTRM